MPVVEKLLKDPDLSFADFCTITNALEQGLSARQILDLPELAHLRLEDTGAPNEGAASDDET